MITRISPANQYWTKSDLTGNSCFVQIGDEIFVVSNVQSDNTFRVYRSLDKGGSFIAAQSYEFPIPNSSFDPVVYYDVQDLHIVGTTVNATNNQLYDIVVFTFSLSTLTLSPPSTLVSATKVRSAYDLTNLEDGTFLLATSLVDSSSPVIDGYALVEIHINAGFSEILSYKAISSSPVLRDGDTYGGLTFVYDIGEEGEVKLFYTRHQTLNTFKPTNHTIEYVVRDSEGVWSVPEVVYSYIGDFIDDKLTVIEVEETGETKVFTHLYYTKLKTSLISHLVIGYFNGTTWLTREITAPISEPTLSIDTDRNVYLSYLLKANASDLLGKLHTFRLNLTNLGLTEMYGYYNNLDFEWLRGSKIPMDTLSKWAVVGSAPTSAANSFVPLFISFLNKAPIAFLTPLTPTLQRGVATTFDASTTTDPDFDPMQFNWSVSVFPPFSGVAPYTLVPSRDGKTATLTMLRSAGPAARTVTVSVSVQDLSAESVPINSPTVVSTEATLPFNYAPLIGWTEPIITGVRNEHLIITPIVTDAENDTMIYSWSQTGGTPVEIIDGVSASTLEVKLVGTRVLGETLTFSLTVSDLISDPVTSTVLVSVPSVLATYLDLNRFSRVFWTSDPTDVTATQPISLRNQSLAWTAPPSRSLSSDFIKMRCSTSSMGGDRQTMMSQTSVMVTGENGAFYRKRFLPNAESGVVDAWHTDNDYTVILTVEAKLYRYENVGPDNTSDNPQSIINLHDYIDGNTVKRMTVNGVVRGRRVIGIHTTVGLLLMQIKEDTFTVESVMKLSVADFTMYGADDVQFVRFVGVESLRKGEILIGTKQGLDYYETLFDLGVRSVTGVWDKTTRINPIVSTGEILKAKPIGYTGLPSTPALTYTYNSETDIYTLEWTVVRPDLISSYDIEARSATATEFQVIKRINTGVVQSIELLPIAAVSKPYRVRIRALNPDGYSPYSNEIVLV